MGKERRLVENLEKSFRKKSRRNEANLGDRIGWINNQLNFAQSENITIDDTNNFNWSSINKRTERAKIATRRRSDFDWERGSFSNQFEQFGNRPPTFTKTTQNERK